MRSRRAARRTGNRSGTVPPLDGPAADLSDLAVRNESAIEDLVGEQLPRAVVALESLLGDCRWRLGPEHPETLVVEGNLAVAYVVTGQEEAGTQLMVANLAAREQVFGDEHPATLTARDAVAGALRLAGRLAEALWQYSRVAPQRNRVLGPAHPDTLTTRLGLGLTFAAAGDTAMALDVVSAALHDCERAGDAPEHAEVLRSCLAELRPAPEPPAAGPVPLQRGAHVPMALLRPVAIDVGSGPGRGGPS